MSNYDSTLRFLFDLQFFGIKVGLENIRFLIHQLGNPHSSFPSIHVAGTNGKGSTASLIASVLIAAGYRTGLYTSPHLITFNERIRIDGRMIGDSDLVRYTKVLRPDIMRSQATFFEATTAIAFQYFADQNVDVAVIETGLGGRLDATNVITPMLSVITNIDLDHMEYLGPTIKHIAFEKGGIMKPGVPCLTGVRNPVALEELKRCAQRSGAKLIEASQASRLAIGDRSLAGLRLSIRTPRHDYKDLHVSLAGDHQAGNAQLALLAIEMVKEKMSGIRISREHISDGFANVRRYSGLRGRFEVVRHTPLTIVDVAHNPDAVRTLVSTLGALIGRPCLTVFGVMKDKDWPKMLALLSERSRMTIAVQPATDRALDTRSIIHHLHASGSKALDGGIVRDAVRSAETQARRCEPILVTGSHYVVGEALNYL